MENELNTEHRKHLHQPVYADTRRIPFKARHGLLRGAKAAGQVPLSQLSGLSEGHEELRHLERRPNWKIAHSS
jgi:hypothetical protein